MAPSRCIFITSFRSLTLATEQCSRRSLSLKMTIRLPHRKASAPSRDGAGEYAVVTDDQEGFIRSRAIACPSRTPHAYLTSAYLPISIVTEPKKVGAHSALFRA